jgi:hypothetical protein
VGILEESKIVQVINRLESTRELLDEVNGADNRYKEILPPIIKKLAGYEKDLSIIKEQLDIENLGAKEQ